MISKASILIPLALALLAPAAAAGGVHVVDKPQLGVFTTLQGAVDAAVDGDVLLVAPGTYAGFTIDGKGLGVFAATDGTVHVTQPVVVRNVVSKAGVVLSGLEIQVPASGSVPLTGLLVEQCSAPVRVQGCSITGGPKSTPGGSAGWAVRAHLAQRLALVDCDLFGGEGQSSFFQPPGAGGGAAVNTQASAVALYDCFVRGGRGRRHAYEAGDGGAGIVVLDHGIVAVGCDVAGGEGGNAIPGGSNPQAGDGGHGMIVQLNAQAQLVDVLTAGGPGGVDLSGMGSSGNPGLPILELGVVVEHPLAARRFAPARRVASDGVGVDVTVFGAPGDLVFVASGAAPGWRPLVPVTGVWLVPVPFWIPAAPIAVLSASGTATLKLFGQDVAGATGRIAYAQGFVFDAGGQLVLSTPLATLVLDRQAQPDCNGNGVLDFVDVLEGPSADCDRNLLPDECPGFAKTLHVDVAAPAGGDGSAAHPFRDLASAFAVANHWDTILVQDGVYSGSNNRNLDFGCRNLTVRSANGPAGCILDLSGGPRAFLLQSGESREARIEGLTIRNSPYQTGTAFIGGGVRTIGSSPTIVDCVFRNNEVSFTAGALSVQGGAPLIEDCLFEDNVNAVQISASGAVLRRCTFLDNSGAGPGSALYLAVGTQPGSVPRVSHCTFIGNGSSLQGGALHMRVSGVAPEPLVVSECLFLGNFGVRGGAVSAYENSATSSLARLVGCTFAFNTAMEGGAIQCASDLELYDSILWGNSATEGDQIVVQWNGHLLVRSSDVQGGQAAVSVEPTSTLQWGAGNLDVDPLFVDPLLDFRLAPGSPCIDAGDNALVALDLGDLDGDGITNEPVPFDLGLLPRFVDDPLVRDTGFGTPPLVDMGAYERQP